MSRRHRGPASLSGQGLLRARALRPVPALRSARDPDGRTASGWPLAPVSSLERAWRLEPVSVIPPPRAHVRRGLAHRDGQSAAYCPEPASRSAQESRSVKVYLSVQVWRPERARPVAPSARAQATVSPWAPARDGLEELLPVAAVVSGEPQAAEAWVRAAAEPRRAAALEAWEPGVPRAVQEAAHAVAEPQPGAAQAASGRQAAVGAAAVPDEPQVAAEAAAVLLGAAERPPAEAARADGAVQLRAAVRSGARAPQAAV